MKRIGILAVVLVATFGLGGVTAAPSLAAEETLCQETAEPLVGRFNDAQCTVEAEPRNFIKIKVPKTKYLGGNTWCAMVFVANTGNFTDSACTSAGIGNFIKVKQGPPRWRIAGAQLKQGTAQIKLQSKGAAVLSVPSVPLTITCNNSISEGSTVEGNGAKQGQGKGRITYSSCKASGECVVAEPITTNQTKSYLAFSKESQSGLVTVFEPVQGTTFTTLKLTKCGVLTGPQEVRGRVAAEIAPREEEGQEGLIVFPKTPIKKVTHEEIEETMELKVGTLESTFSGVYGARLATNQPFGVYTAKG